jgi:hypothetical protein
MIGAWFAEVSVAVVAGDDYICPRANDHLMAQFVQDLLVGKNRLQDLSSPFVERVFDSPARSLATTSVTGQDRNAFIADPPLARANVCMP